MSSTQPVVITPQLERIFRGHRHAVTGVSFHPMLEQAATSSADGAVMVWNFAASKRAFRYTGHRGPVNDVAFSPTGDCIASVSSDTTLRLWTPSVRGDSAVIKAHCAPARSLSFFSDGCHVMTGGDDKAVKMWSTSTERFVSGFNGHQNWVRSVDVSQDGRLAASGGDDKAVFIWDVRTKRATQTLYDHLDSVSCVAFHPDGSCVAAGSTDSWLHVWDLRMNTLIQSYERAHQDSLTSLQFHPSGGWMVSTGMDGMTKLWDAKEGLLFCSIGGHEGPVRAASFSKCGSLLGTAGHDSTVVIWTTGAAAATGPLKHGQPGSKVNPENTVMPPNLQSPAANQGRPMTPSKLLNSSARGGDNSMMNASSTSINNNTRSTSASRRRPMTPSSRPQSQQPQQQSALREAAAAAYNHNNNKKLPSVSNSPQKFGQTSAVKQQRKQQNHGPTTIEVDVGGDVSSMEEVIRQADVTQQGQNLLSARISHAEDAHQQLATNLLERDARHSEQFSALQLQIQHLQKALTESKQESAQTRDALAQQTAAVRQLMHQQTQLVHIIDRLGGSASAVDNVINSEQSPHRML